MSNKRPLNITDSRWEDVIIYPKPDNKFITIHHSDESELEGVLFNQTVINDNTVRKLDKE